MKGLKKRNIVRTLVFLAPLLLGLIATASAQNQCSMVSLLGDWGYTETGTIILPTGPVLLAIVGRVTSDAGSNLSGTQTSSLGGQMSQETMRGTFTLDPDCSGVMTVSIYNESGTLLRTATLNFVVDDHARELRAILTSLVVEPSHTSLPTVVTMNARKQSPGAQ